MPEVIIKRKSVDGNIKKEQKSVKFQHPSKTTNRSQSRIYKPSFDYNDNFKNLKAPIDDRFRTKYLKKMIMSQSRLSSQKYAITGIFGQPKQLKQKPKKEGGKGHK